MIGGSVCAWLFLKGKCKSQFNTNGITGSTAAFKCQQYRLRLMVWWSHWNLEMSQWYYKYAVFGVRAAFPLFIYDWKYLVIASPLVFISAQCWSCHIFIAVASFQKRQFHSFQKVSRTYALGIQWAGLPHSKKVIWYLQETSS